MDDDDHVGVLRARASAICSGVKRWCTEQCPAQSRTRLRSQRLERLAAHRAVRARPAPERHLVERDAHGGAGVAAEVLVREEEHALLLRERPFQHLRALLEVQTAPPCSPTNAFSAAAEFMYVMGSVSCAMPSSSSSAQAL